MRNFWKRTLSAALGLLMLAAVIPSAQAAGYGYYSYSRYYDIYDEDTALSMEVLSALGIVNGNPDGGYHPNDYLTRAEFSKMAVLMLGLDDTNPVPRVLFSDVLSSHWGFRYVNLAYENGLIQGYGNGKFGPGDRVTYVQVLTILLRMLGYTSAEIGTAYPDDYLRFGESLGLAEGVMYGASDPVTRGSAAIMLVNALASKTKGGNSYYKTLAPASAEDVILLETDGISDSGEYNCARIYQNGKTVWYGKSGDLDPYLTGAQGIALIDDSNKLLAFLPQDSGYEAVSGLILEARRAPEDDDADMAYETVIYADGYAQSYPHNGTIADNLSGSSGTLLVDKNGSAAAFISGSVSGYVLKADAVFLDDDADDDRAAFYVGGKTAYYDWDDDSDLDDDDIGLSGYLVLDDDEYICAFIPHEESEEYTVKQGILMDFTSKKATFLMGERQKTYDLECSLSGVSAGTSGTILLDDDNNVVAFSTEGSGNLSDTVIILDDDCTAEDGTRHCVMVYERSKIVYYEQDGYELDRDLVGCSGTLVLDDDDMVIGFYPDGGEYALVSGLLLESTASRATFYIDGQMEEYRLSGSVSSADLGSSGLILLNENQRVEAFIPEDGDESYSLSKSGILISVDTVAADGKTALATLYTDGRIQTFRVDAALDAASEGACGRFLLDENDRVVDFIPEEANLLDTTVVLADEGLLECAEGSYALSGSTAVIREEAVTTWDNVQGEIDPGDRICIYFDELGSIDVLLLP